MGVESAAVYYGEERYGFSLTQVRTVDTIVGLSTLVGYGLVLVFIIIPARWRQSEALRVIERDIAAAAAAEGAALAGEVLSPLEPDHTFVLKETETRRSQLELNSLVPNN